MKKNIINPTSYNSLLNLVRKEITQGILRAQNAYNREKIITYWKIGKSISKHFKQNKIEDSGRMILTNLSKDLDIGRPLLYQIVQFHKAFPKFDPLPNVSWSHYRTLSFIKDKKDRLHFETKVSNENLSLKDFEILVQEYKTLLLNKPVLSQPMKQRLIPRRGELYHYQVIKEEYSDKYLIDCGFRIFREVNYKPKEIGIVEARKTDKGYSYKKSEVKRKFIYTYKAYVRKVIDADTIWVNIDLGFGTWTKQKIRFRGIDAPEKDTAGYLKSNQYLENLLKDIPFIVIKSYSRGKFDRFLSDIFYLKDEKNPEVILRNGTFLNQELLNKGLAKFFVK